MDDDVTKPDLPSGLGSGDEPTNPGKGTGEAVIAVSGLAHRAVATLRTLEDTCPKAGEPGREYHLRLLALAHGELGDLHHDTRRVILQRIREEFP
jgi:hypothetical protein